MSKPIYIYPQWLAAKRKLFEALENAGGLTTTQVDILSEWFRYHCFEIGCEQVVHDSYLQKTNLKDLEHYTREKGIHMIAKGIFDKGLFHEQRTHNTKFPSETRYQMRVLVLGAPDLVGPESRSEVEE